MAKQNGQVLTCDRCGESVFLRHTGYGERDGGYTRWDKFESPPEGWDYVHNIGDLCPNCARAYKQMIEEFQRNRDAWLTGAQPIETEEE